MTSHFEGFNFNNFWEESEYATKEYVGKNITPKMIESVERELGYKLPDSYIALLQTQNGGIPNNKNFPTTEPTSWSDDHVALTGIMGIDSSKKYSLCGDLGSEFMKEEWGYPDIGVYICHCPSAGHDMIALDYSKCDRNGEPSVVHVGQEDDYKITLLADNFETFIRGLLNDEVFDTADEDLKHDIAKIENGNFSDLLSSLIENQKELNFNKIIRNVCKKLTLEKGHFALHADKLSYLVYDIQFFLYTSNKKVRSATEYLKIYPSMIAFGNGEFSTDGYGPSFVEGWIKKRISNIQISKDLSGDLFFSKVYENELWMELKKYEGGPEISK